MIGGQTAAGPGPWSLDRSTRLFPILQERRVQASTSLSGGQQQMVAIGRALMANPDLLLFDEISLGLAPDHHQVHSTRRCRASSEGGMSAVVVEQDIVRAMEVSDRLYCLQEGRVSLEGRSGTVSREEISKAYFGI